MYYTVCLDGSPPAYHFDKGFGAGVNNWLIHIEVCSFLAHLKCIQLKRKDRVRLYPNGSSRLWDEEKLLDQLVISLVN